MGNVPTSHREKIVRGRPRTQAHVMYTRVQTGCTGSLPPRREWDHTVGDHSFTEVERAAVRTPRHEHDTSVDHGILTTASLRTHA